MATLTDKTLEWLKKFAKPKTIEEHGGVQRIARATGLEYSYLHKVLKPKDRKKPPKFNLDHIETIAETRLMRPSQIMKEIETQDTVLELRPRTSKLPVAEQAHIEWQKLFRTDELRSRRVLMNLRHQEELDYTELISRVVRLILERGADKAAFLVAEELQQYHERHTKKREEIRQLQAEEYRDLK